VEKVSWQDKKTNEEVLIAVGEEMYCASNIEAEKELHKSCYARRQFVKACDRRMLGKKPRIGVIDDLKEESYTEMKRRAEDRDKWRTWMPRTCRKAEN